MATDKILCIFSFLMSPSLLNSGVDSRVKEHSSGFCYLTINSRFMENKEEEEEEERRFGSRVKLLDCTASF